MRTTVETLKLYQRLLEKPRSWLKAFLLASPDEGIVEQCPSGISEKEREMFYRVAAKSWFPGEKVLLVEDNEVCGETLKNLMERWGMTVKLVDSCELALQVAYSDMGFDFALIDYSLPDGTGDDIARVFRERWRGKGTSLISLSGNRFFPDESLYNEGIEKPIRPESLRRAMIDFLIARANGSENRNALKLAL